MNSRSLASFLISRATLPREWRFSHKAKERLKEMFVDTGEEPSSAWCVLGTTRDAALETMPQLQSVESARFRDLPILRRLSGTLPDMLARAQEPLERTALRRLW